MADTPFTVADYLLTRLKQLNVTEVFQIPGDYVRNFTTTLENFDGVRPLAASTNSMLLMRPMPTGALGDWQPARFNME